MWEWRWSFSPRSTCEAVSKDPGSILGLPVQGRPGCIWGSPANDHKAQCWRGYRASPVRKGRESCGCLPWRRGGFGGDPPLSLKGRYKEDGARIFSVVPGVRTKGKGHRLEYWRLHPNIRKHCCIVQVLEQWQRLPRELGSPPLQDVGLGTLLWRPC